MPGQRRERQAERDARQAAAAYVRDQADGLTTSEAATLLDVPARTLRRWIQHERDGTLVASPIGRPAKRATPHDRAALLADLAARPRLGVLALRERHPAFGRHEIEELSARARSVRTTRDRDVVASLGWTLPGAVWAVDFSDAGHDIEGTFPCLFLVRDLASSYVLLSLPCRRQDAATVRAAFAALLAHDGPPLVVKADNGGGLVAELVRDLLDAHEVLLLRSPPYTPQYNGACEAGGGSIKTRAHHVAAAVGREVCWSCDDVEAARLEANREPRPWGPSGPSPAERWKQRVAISDELRATVRADVGRRVLAELAARGLGLCAQVDDGVAQQIMRAAVAGSLRAHRLLSITDKTIPARRGPRRTDRREGKPEGVTSSS